MKRKIGLIALVVVGGVLIGGAAYATIPDASGVIHGCYARSGGALRVIDDGVINCSKSETSLNWNVKGPAGPQGAQGIQGPQGQAGPTGPAGPSWTIYVVTATEPVPARETKTVTRSCNAGDLALAASYDMFDDAGGAIDPPYRSERTAAGTWTYTVYNPQSSDLTAFSLGVLCADTTP